MSEKPISIFIAEDETIVRQGLCSLLSLWPEVRIVGEAGDGQTTIQEVLDKDVDIVLLDIKMPNLTGVEATRRLKKYKPNVKILILTSYGEEDLVMQLLRHGADGFLLKNVTPVELRNAIKMVYKGQYYFSTDVSGMVLRKTIKELRSDAMLGNASSNPNESLTAREREILQLIAEGKTNKEIADLLFISVRTVDTHRTNIMRKLDLHDSVSLVLYAINNGLVLQNVKVLPH